MIGAPVCPYENATSPYNQLLCDVWFELQNLEGKFPTISIPALSPSLDSAGK